MPTQILSECPACRSNSLKLREWKFASGGHQFRQQCPDCGWASSAIAKDIAIETNKSESFEPFDIELNNHRRSVKPAIETQSSLNVSYAKLSMFDNL